MTDYQYGTGTEMVVASHWLSFFNRVAEDKKGVVTSVQRDASKTLRDPPPPGAPLQKLVYYHVHRRLKIVTGPAGTEETVTAEGVDVVWAIHDAESQLMAIQITLNDGGNVVLRFAVEE